LLDRPAVDGELVLEQPQRGLRLRAVPAASEDLLALLGAAAFGSAGLRYRRLDVSERLAELPPSLFFELRRDEELLAAYTLTPHRLVRGEQTLPALYRGLLCVADSAQGQGLGRLLASEALRWCGESLREAGTAPLSWGCVESGNARSLRTLRGLGAGVIGSLETRMVYRQWPRRRLSLVDAPPPADVSAALRRSRADCALRAEAGGVAPYVAVDDGARLVVGARVAVARLDLLRIGGVWDWLSHHLLRRVPMARRRYDPRCFRYLALSDVVVEPAHAALWPDFVETLMARYGVHMAMLACDPASAASRALHGAGLFGRFGEMTRQRLEVLATGEREALGRASPLGLAPLIL
jgi:GNAT superfamily N-acetyltransferase